MITVIPSADRYSADHGWLQTHWHFSFADYYDPKNMNWSALRVFNDDIVKAGGGFDFHPHKDMEIVSYIVDGELEHRDRLGNRHTNKPGEVQVMSAGRGIVHAENNPSKSDMRLIQLWILPRNKNNEPRWEQKPYTRADRHNRLLQVVAPTDHPVDGVLTIDQDASIFVSALDAGKEVTHNQVGTHAYLFVIAGEVSVNGKTLKNGDQARVADEKSLAIKAAGDAEFILLDLP
ncbi:pirin family protein [Humisphaera borealis]|uniref:Pirin family protein n=1 Tax=Humisphaera borealis TaxID=2807512 RepID=A0A7M2WWS6_9BACT|nr:pirin family protein [Humisphaera borealis]QOV89926.1 pirin family protein [Humisphaera borealis]